MDYCPDCGFPMTVVGKVGSHPAKACTSCGSAWAMVRLREPSISKEELEARRERQRVRRFIDGKEVPCSH